MVGRINKNNRAENQKPLQKDESTNELKKISKRTSEKGLNQIKSTPQPTALKQKHQFSKKIPNQNTANKTGKTIQAFLKKNKGL